MLFSRHLFFFHGRRQNSECYSEFPRMSAINVNSSSWMSLQHGISSVLESMHPYWKQESDLAQFVDSQRALSTADLSMATGYQPLDEDMAHLDQTINGLQMIQKRVTHNLEHTQRLGELIEFVQQFRDDFPSQTSEQTFDRIQTLLREAQTLCYAA